MNTNRVIDTLARDLAPAPPLATPWTRAACWLLGAVTFLSTMTVVMASPARVALNERDWLFVFSQLAALVTAVIATGAAFASTVPGGSRRSVPVAALVALIWLGSLCVGAIREWTGHGVNLAAPAEWGCVAMILLGGGPPAFVLGRMLRRGAPLTPALTASMGALASAALASISACLSRPHPSDAVTLVWHGTTILVIVLSVALAAHSILPWNTARPH